MITALGTELKAFPVRRGRDRRPKRSIVRQRQPGPADTATVRSEKRSGNALDHFQCHPRSMPFLGSIALESNVDGPLNRGPVALEKHKVRPGSEQGRGFQSIFCRRLPVVKWQHVFSSTFASSLMLWPDARQDRVRAADVQRRAAIDGARRVRQDAAIFSH